MDTSVAEPAVPPAHIDSILDRPIRVENFEDLPAQGEPGKLYRCASTRAYYRWTGERYVEMETQHAFRWRPLERVVAPLVDILARARKCDWFYFRNGIHSRYINIRVDMRDGNCLITDNAGHPISIDELLFQEARPIGRPLGSKNKT